MNDRIKMGRVANCGRLIARFGDARLVRNADGATRLCGGTAHDKTAAKEWISMFMHEAVLRGDSVRRN